MACETLARLQAAAEDRQAAGLDDVLVHVRFNPSGEIFSIGEKPAGLSPSEWLNYLRERASPHYRALAGGRGVFRIPRRSFAAIREGLPA